MISVEEALQKILDNISVLDSEEKSLLDCLGQAVAEDIYAPYDIPPENNSGMDGYATCSEFITSATKDNPVILKVIGEQPAGSSIVISISKNTCVKIMTGAIIPEGYDVVVPFEQTDHEQRKNEKLNNDEIGIHSFLNKGSHIRYRGEDIKKNEAVFKRGSFLRSSEIGMLASLGIGKVKVTRKPVIGIIATGSELVELNRKLSPGKIYNSNSYSIAALVKQLGGIPQILGIAQDTKSHIAKAVKRGLNYDMLITSGGVSVGDYDVVKDVLAAEGTISFWTVRMKPGKPLAFGMLKGNKGRMIPHLGLPGNPASCLVTLEIFGKPAIYKMMGKSDFESETIRAVFEDTMENLDGRRVYSRARVYFKDGKYHAKLAGAQGSAMLKSMTKANGLAIIPENISKISPGSIVDVLMLD
jgi:molybdopterin molybdotransferase